VRPARLLRHPEHVLGQILLVGERKQHWRHLKADKQGHHIGRYPLDEPEAKFHGFQEFLAGRSCRAVFRAACVLGAFSRTSSAVLFRGVRRDRTSHRRRKLSRAWLGRFRLGARGPICA